MLPSAPREVRPVEPIDWLALAPFVSATFLAKLSIPPLGARGLSLFFPVLIATTGLQLATGRLTFVTGRLAWFAATAASIAVMQLFAVQEFSAASLALFVAVGLALASRTTSSSGWRFRAWFGTAATVIAAAGLAQFVLQFVVPLNFVYPVENLVPPAWRTQLFNNVATINWRVSVYRVNGVFMLEASEFSQLCAIALVNELIAVETKTWRVALFIAAILASYSGTGLMILAAALPVVVIRSGRWDLVARGLLLLIPLGLLAGPLHLDSTLARVNEFSGPGSSGYARFVAWMTCSALRVGRMRPRCFSATARARPRARVRWCSARFLTSTAHWRGRPTFRSSSGCSSPARARCRCGWRCSCARS